MKFDRGKNFVVSQLERERGENPVQQIIDLYLLREKYKKNADSTKQLKFYVVCCFIKYNKDVLKLCVAAQNQNGLAWDIT